jgi:hypothetical protein
VVVHDDRVDRLGRERTGGSRRQDQPDAERERLAQNVDRPVTRRLRGAPYCLTAMNPRAPMALLVPANVKMEPGVVPLRLKVPVVVPGFCSDTSLMRRPPFGDPAR